MLLFIYFRFRFRIYIDYFGFGYSLYLQFKMLSNTCFFYRHTFRPWAPLYIWKLSRGQNASRWNRQEWTALYAMNCWGVLNISANKISATLRFCLCAYKKSMGVAKQKSQSLWFLAFLLNIATFSSKFRDFR